MRIVVSILALFLSMNELASASNVAARVSGGQLIIYGDSGDNTITIASFQSGEIHVIGAPSVNGEPTSINGQVNGSVKLTGWNGGIYCYMYAGSDSVSLPLATVLGTTHFDLGEGHDDLIIGSMPLDASFMTSPGTLPISGYVDLRSVLYVIGANGDDYVSLINAKVQYVATFDLGDGADELLVGDTSVPGTLVEFQSNCNVYPGSGLDAAHFSSTMVRGNFVFDDYIHSLDLSLRGVSIQQNAFIYGTSAKDSISLEQVAVTSLLQIFSEQDNDSVKLMSTQSETLEVFAGSGVDLVQLDSITSNTCRAFLDSGIDTLNVSLGKFQKLFWYGGSENDTFNVATTNAKELNLFGDSGTDTLIRSANTIGTTRLYSVENQ